MRLPGLLFVLLALSQFAFPAEPASESATDKAVRFTDALEKDPLGDQAPEMRRWLIAWITETPDFTVTVCDILGPVPGKKIRYSAELAVQQMFGNVSYQIRNPGQHEETLLQLAGVESVLNAYAALLVQDPKEHIKYFDELLEKRAQGLLEAQVIPKIAKACKT
jgi:hypothetical protein